MSMEKITKDELMEKLGVFAMSDDELENVAGGNNDCYLHCHQRYPNSSDPGLERCLNGCY